jgi:hypothetical protein
MTKLNKIAQVLVLSGMSCWVSIAQAADIEISQNTQVNQETKVSQQVDSSDNSAQMSTKSDTSVESDTQVKANSEEANASESAPNETEDQPSSNATNSGIANVLDNKSELITSLSNNVGENISVISGSRATLAQSLNQVTSIAFPTLPESETPEEPGEIAPNEALATPELAVLNPNVDSATSFVNTSAVATQLSGNTGNNTLVNTASNLNQSLTQTTSANLLVLPENDTAEEAEEVVPSEAMTTPGNVALNPTIDSANSFANTSHVSQQISSNVQNIVSLDAAGQTTQVIEQTVNANVADAITSNAQTAITENVNSQINNVVTEQINTELAAATAAEVTNSLVNNLDIGL